jgi:hypothetical protein
VSVQSVEIDVVLKYSLPMPLPGVSTSDSDVTGDSSREAGVAVAAMVGNANIIESIYCNRMPY